LLAVEVGHDQGERVAELFALAGFSAIQRAMDYSGIERVVSGVAGVESGTRSLRSEPPEFLVGASGR
jgi:methylase of polypeptide subunit release factors